MFSIRRAVARALTRTESLSIYKPRSITTFATPSIRSFRPIFASLPQRRFASDEPAERHPALDSVGNAGQASVAQSEAVPTSEPAQPETTTAEPFDMSEIQPAESTEIPQPASAVESEQAFASSSQQALEENVASGLASGTAAASAASARPTGQDADGKMLYIGNLFFDVTEEDLKREFSNHGNVTEVKIVYDSRGLSKGFGYVHYETRAEAEAAMQALDRQVFEGRRMSVQWANRTGREVKQAPFSAKNPPSKTLFIGNMSFELSDQDLNDLFRDIKNVLDVRVAIDRRTGQPRGFAHADFTDIASAELALNKLDGKELYGRKLRLDYSMPSARVRSMH